MYVTVTVDVNPNTVSIMRQIVEEGSNTLMNDLDPQMLTRAQCSLEDVVKQITERINHG